MFVKRLGMNDYEIWSQAFQDLVFEMKFFKIHGLTERFRVRKNVGKK